MAGWVASVHERHPESAESQRAAACSLSLLWSGNLCNSSGAQDQTLYGNTWGIPMRSCLNPLDDFFFFLPPWFLPFFQEFGLRMFCCIRNLACTWECGCDLEIKAAPSSLALALDPPWALAEHPGEERSAKVGLLRTVLRINTQGRRHSPHVLQLAQKWLHTCEQWRRWCESADRWAWKPAAKAAGNLTFNK